MNIQHTKTNWNNKDLKYEYDKLCQMISLGAGARLIFINLCFIEQNSYLLLLNVIIAFCLITVDKVLDTNDEKEFCSYFYKISATVDAC